MEADRKDTHPSAEEARLAYELTYHKFLLNRDHSHSLFREISKAEYIALHLIAKNASASGRIYLADLAKQLEMPISSMSRMVRRLKDRSLVHWSHTGNGSDGTFVSITDSGFQAMRHQDAVLEAYYHQVIERFGHEKLTQLLHQLDALESIMNEVFTQEGDAIYGHDTT